MIQEIPPLPVIPQTLRIAASQGSKLVPFVGASVSRLAGCPGWDDFAQSALAFFVSKGVLSHAQLDQLSHLSARVKLSIALDLENSHPHLRVDFARILEPNPTKRQVGERIYGALWRLASTFITTNYDDWLDTRPTAEFTATEASTHDVAPPQPSTFYKESDITIENIDTPNAVFHIHGSVLDRTSMLLTTAHYLERYSSHRIDGFGATENPFLTFLQTLFELKNVLFIGYGLAELEILEYIIQKGELRRDGNEEPRHYVLQGFFSHELALAQSLEGYFKQFGVGLLPFSRDRLDHDQLTEVIDYLVMVLPRGAALSSAKRQEMDDLLL